MRKLLNNPLAIACFGKRACEEIEARFKREDELRKATAKAADYAKLAEAKFTIHAIEMTDYLEAVLAEAEAEHPAELKAFQQSQKPFAALVGAMGNTGEEDLPGENTRRLN